MKKLLLFGVPAILAVAGLLFFAHSAQSFGFKGSRHKPGVARDFILFRIEQMTKDLNLTPDQKSRLDSLKDDLETVFDQRWETRQQVHETIADELKNENPDISKITPLIDKQIDETAQNAHQMVDRIAEFYSSLTPEQKKMLSEKLSERFGHDLEN